MKLTMRAIESLKCGPGKRDQLFFDDEQTGLAVRVLASGSRSYLAQFRANGLKRRIPLGSCEGISLADARKAVRALVGDAARGIDAAAERKAAKHKAELDALTLGNLIDHWRDLHLNDRRPNYSAAATSALRRVFAKHLGRPAADLDRTDVVRALDNLATQGKAPMAAAVARYGGALFGWAIGRGRLSTSPFERVPTAPTVRRDRVLKDDEIRAIFAATAGPGTFNGITRMLLLSGQRREEVAGLRWDEIDPGLRTWTLPPNRAKNGREHFVPLSEQAEALLRAQPRQSSPLVFPGERGTFSGWSKAKRRLDRDSGVTDWTLHDIRRSVATGLQKLGVRLEVTEAALNHVSGSRAGIVGIYQRHDFAAEKRTALTAWGEHVAAIIAGNSSADNVTPLRRSA